MPTRAEFIGVIANESLYPAANLTIYGSSSRGLFVTTESDWMIFLSQEPFRGPMTINLSGNPSMLDSLSKGDIALVDADQLIFPRKGLYIELAEAQVWSPPLPPDPSTATDPRTIQALLSQLGDELLNAITDPAIQPDSIQPKGEALVVEITRSLQAGEQTKAKEAALSLLGMGSGLTPEGDDFLIGLFFSLSRANRLKNWQKTWKDITEEAYQRTTRLSANLIEAAGKGLADERLVAAHDALYRGDTNAQKAIRDLLGWGSTSGWMALAGIAAGILTPPKYE